ncbi:hypothetical protein V8V91_05150 [Algoriphagus halophilus]|uniref:hypothetical protein n=1 Tax=Algoriphagus halophilus TaxID=226505 RepID=UPI00358E0853
MAIRNIILVFLISGFWHGANWTFLVWGGIHAALFIPVFILGKSRVHLGEYASGNYLSFKEILQIVVTFVIVSMTWIFFRANSIHQAWGYLAGLIENPFLPSNYGWIAYDLRVLLLIFLLLEWVGRFHFNWLEKLEGKWYRYPAYFSTMIVIIWWGMASEKQEFIYFQF